MPTTPLPFSNNRQLTRLCKIFSGISRGLAALFVFLFSPIGIRLLVSNKKPKIARDSPGICALKILQSRELRLKQLAEEEFDLLVIGGGATGAGIALDGATRGLKVALVEANDFGSGTSSRSTKLLHGGVRYLEAAVKKGDLSQFHLVKDALRERATLFKIAPHLTRVLPILLPLYSWWKIPYYLFGLKLYDYLSGKRGLGSSHRLSKEETLKSFPLLCEKGLKGAVVYYDGQFDDARMNICLIVTAAHYGAVVANYLEVTQLLKEKNSICGAIVKDKLSGSSWPIRSKVIINATGPQVDAIRRLDQPDIAPLIRTSAGSHLLLNKQFAPPSAGMLIPHTDDGRVLFLLPWEGQILVGTTDVPVALPTDTPHPSKEEIDYLLAHASKYLKHPITRADISASWTGLRPLVQNHAISATAQLSRDHVIETSSSGLMTITGGKWTTYRRMAQETVDKAITLKKLKAHHRCLTARLKLIGSKNPVDKILQSLTDFDEDIALHLVHAYGDQALQIAALAHQGYRERLSPSHPYIAAEVLYAVQHEYACCASDILERRTRLAFLDTHAANQALPFINDLLTRLAKVS